MRDPGAAQQAGQTRAGQQLLAVGEDERGPGAKGHQDLGDRRVEAERGKLQDTVARADREGPPLRFEQVAQPAMGDHHPLGTAGGARRVEPVGGALRQGARRGRRRAGGAREIAARQASLAGTDRADLEQHDARAAGGKAGRQGRGGHQHRRPRFLEQQVHPLGGVGGIERHIRAAGLPHRQHGDHHRGRTRQADRHGGLQSHPELAQPRGQGPDAAEQFAIGEDRIVMDHRRRLGVHRRGGEEAGHRRRGQVPVPRPALAGAQLFQLGRIEEGELGERAVGIGGDPAQQDAPTPCQAVHRGGVEEIEGMLPEAGEAVRRLFGQHGDVGQDGRCPGSASSRIAARPGRRSASRGSLRSTKRTRKSGDRPRRRSGLRASTRISKGTSFW